MNRRDFIKASAAAMAASSCALRGGTKSDRAVTLPITAPATSTRTDSSGVDCGRSVRIRSCRPAGIENGTSRVTVAPSGRPSERAQSHSWNGIAMPRPAIRARSEALS